MMYRRTKDCFSGPGANGYRAYFSFNLICDLGRRLLHSFTADRLSFLVFVYLAKTLVLNLTKKTLVLSFVVSVVAKILSVTHARPVKLKYTTSCGSALQFSARNTSNILNR